MLKNNEVLIKWTGSKRIQADQIISHFPQNIKIYYEPFLGGGSVFFHLLLSNKKIDRFACSDLNSPLIGIYKLIQSNPDELIEDYSNRWNELKKSGRDYYYSLRKEFNLDQDAKKFFFILRTCRNGLVRYNTSGEFNSAFHDKRDGINPKTLSKTIQYWYSKFKNNNVEFQVRNYEEISSSNDDFVYIDPPYITDNEMYFGTINTDKLYNWLRNQYRFAFSFNGFENDIDCRADVPKDIYDKELLIDAGFNPMSKSIVIKRDALYLKGL